MAVRKASYLDVPAQQRRASAKIARARYQALLSSPTLSEDQRAHLVEQVRRLAKWEAGKLPVGA